MKIVPLSAAQAGMLLGSLTAPGSYLGVHQVHFTDSVTALELAHRLEHCARRHPALRLRVVADSAVDLVGFLATAQEVADQAFPPVPATLTTATQIAEHLMALIDPIEGPLLYLAVVPPGPDAAAPDGSEVVLVTHHALLDAVGADQLLAELAQPVSGCATPEHAYRLFTEWLTAQNVAHATEFWRASYANHPAVQRASLPKRDWDQGANRHTVTFRAARDELARFAATSTDATILRALWSVVLDFVAPHSSFVTTTSLRHAAAGSARCVGMLTETIPVPTYAPRNTSLAEVINTHHSWWQDSLAHHHVGLTAALAASGRRAEDLWCLFSVDPALHQSATSEHFSTLAVTDRTHYPVEVSVTPDHEHYTVTVSADAAMWSPKLTQQVATTYQTLLRHGPNSTTTLALQAAAQRYDRPRTTRPPVQGSISDGAQIPSLDTIVEIFLADCVPEPVLVDVTDVNSAPHPVTGRTLHDQVNQWATRLAEHGVTAGSTVAVVLPRSATTLQLMLACWLHRAAFLPVDAAAPQHRQEHATAHATHLVTESGISSGPGRSTNPAESWVAHICLTSGTTGTPKVVATSAANLTQHLVTNIDHLYPPAPAQVAHCAAFHFDAHLDASLAILAGHCVHVIADEVLYHPAALSEYVQAAQIDYLDLTPTLWQVLLAHGLPHAPRVLVSGGEAIHEPTWAALAQLAMAHGSTAMNVYGPTETTVDASSAVISGPTVTIGTLRPGVSAEVLSGDLIPRPTTQVGQLYLGGAGLSYGYLGDPATTASRFVAAPDGARRYASGDAAAITAHGELTFHGRVDDQISLNGLRIEPGEITSVLLKHPQVIAAAVTTRSTVHGKQLAALVVTTPELTVPADLHTHLAKYLPAPLIPRQCHAVAHLPITPNGKVDHQQLEALIPDPSTTTDLGEQPGSATEELACAGFAHILDTAQVSLTTDFFTCGGDSLAALRLAAWFRESGWTVSVAHIMNARTPKLIAAFLTPITLPTLHRKVSMDTVDQASRQALQNHCAHLGVAPPDRVWQLTPSAVGMYLESQKLGAADPYTTVTHYELAGLSEADGSKVTTAMHQLFVAHPHLLAHCWQGPMRTPMAFSNSKDPVRQDFFDWQDIDLDELADRFIQVRELLHRDQTQADFSAHCRWMLIQHQPLASGAIYSLFVGLHHVHVDGWSTKLFTEDLALALAGRKIPERPSPNRFAQWAQLPSNQEPWQQYWQQRSYPSTLVAVTEPGAREHTRSWSAPDDLVAALTEQAQHQGVTVSTLLAAAWAYTVAALADQPEVTFGMAVAGRDPDVPDADRLIGLMMGIAPITVATQTQAVSDLQQQLADVTTAVHLGLPHILRTIREQPTDPELFDSLLVIENLAATDPVQIDDVTVIPVSGDDGAHYPLTATVLCADGLAVEVVTRAGYATSLAKSAMEMFTLAITTIAHGRQPQLPHTAQPAPPTAARPAPTQPTPTIRPIFAEPVDVNPDTVATIVRCAADVLEHPVTDATDFMAAGGDSIAAMHLVAQCYQHDVQFTVADVFAARTLTHLAQHASATARPEPTPVPPATAPIALPERTPALRWFDQLPTGGNDLCQEFQIPRINLPVDVNLEQVRIALTKLAAQHDSMRLRRTDNQWFIDPDATAMVVAASPDAATPLVQALRYFDVEAGKLLWAQLGAEELTLVFHHVAVDMVSWPIVAEQFTNLLFGAQALPPTVGLPDVVAAMANHAAAQPKLPLPGADQCTAHTLAQIQQVQLAPATAVPWVAAQQDTIRLSEAQTAALLAIQNDPEKVLLTAFAVLANQQAVPGLLVDTEQHGRELATGLGLDVIHSVGWYTTTCAHVVPAGTPAAAIQATQLRRHNSAEAELISWQTPASTGPGQVLLNYLGTLANPDLATPQLLTSDLDTATFSPLSHSVELTAYVTAGGAAAQLVIDWRAHPELRCTAQDFAAALNQVIDEWSQAPTVWPLPDSSAGMIVHTTTTQDPYLAVTDVELTGPVDADLIHAALSDVLAEHPQLRVRLCFSGQKAGFEVTDHTQVPLTTHSDVCEPYAVSGLMHAELERPFDLTTAPLVRAQLLTTTTGTWRLLLTSHHAVLDGWSGPLLVQEFARHYARRAAGGQNKPLVPAAGCAYDVTIRHRGHSTPQLTEWAQVLATAEPTILATTPTAQRPAICTAQLAITDDWIADQERTQHISAATVIAHAFGQVLAKLVNQESVTFGLVVSGRSHLDLHLIGNFVAVVPVPCTTSPESLQEIQRTIGLTTHGQVPSLAELTQFTGEAVLFDTLLTVENYPTSKPSMPEPVTLSVVDGTDRTHYPLAALVEKTTTGWQLTVEVRTEYLPVTLARTVVSAWSDALTGVPLNDQLTYCHKISNTTAVDQDSEPDHLMARRKLTDVCTAYSTVLGTACFADSDLFSLGGDSMTVMRLLAELSSLGWELTPQAVFIARTPAQLVPHLSRTEPTAPAPQTDQSVHQEDEFGLLGDAGLAALHHGLNVSEDRP